jgi:hypothetical protein
MPGRATVRDVYDKLVLECCGLVCSALWTITREIWQREGGKQVGGC